MWVYRQAPRQTRLEREAQTGLEHRRLADAQRPINGCASALSAALFSGTYTRYTRNLVTIFCQDVNQLLSLSGVYPYLFPHQSSLVCMLAPTVSFAKVLNLDNKFVEYNRQDDLQHMKITRLHRSLGN